MIFFLLFFNTGRKKLIQDEFHAPTFEQWMAGKERRKKNLIVGDMSVNGGGGQPPARN